MLWDLIADSSPHLRIPRNIEFAQMDLETPWQGLEPNSWDLIHMRTLKGSIQSWPQLYAQVFRYVYSDCQACHILI